MNEQYEINEADPKYSINKLIPTLDITKKLFTKVWLIFEERSRFWKPRIDVGKKCMNFKRRDVFTSAQRKTYNQNKKIPIETQEMKTALNTLSDLVKKGVRSTTIKYEDNDPGQNVPTPEVVNVVLTDMEKNRLKMELVENSIREDALVTGFPNWAWINECYEIDGITPKLEAEHPLWESMLPQPYFKKKDGSDIVDVMRLSFVRKCDLKEAYPERYKDYEKFNPQKEYDPGNMAQTNHEPVSKNAYDRASLIYNAICSRAATHSHDGYVLLVEWFHQIKKERELYIRENPFDIVEIPKHWDEERKQRWVNTHPEHNLTKYDNVKTQWLTSVTDDGFVWENDELWYQENGSLPGRCYIPDNQDQIPTGAGEDMLPYVLSVCACNTEGLHQVRTGTGSVTHVTGGSFKYPDQVRNELTSDNGVVVHKTDVIKKLGGIKNAVTTEKRTPNTTFLDFADRQRNDMRVSTGLNDALQGITHPRQSKLAKELDITQGIATQSPYVRNYSNFKLELKNLELTLIPYIYTAHEVITIDDEFGFNEQSVEVNQKEINPFTGQGEVVANDLTIARFKAIPAMVDDSPTNKDRERLEVMEFLAAAGNSIVQWPRIFATMLIGLENRYAKELGMQLMQEAVMAEQQQAQQQQAEMEKEMAIEKGRRDVDYAKMNATKKAINVKVSPEDVQKTPAESQALIDVTKS